MNILKKQGVAWVLTIVMIAAAVGIGQAKARPGGLDAGSAAYVYDDAGVLSASAEKKLTRRGEQLWDDLGVVIAVVTCNYGYSDLYSYAMDYAGSIGLGGYDFIVVLDISGDNYWLVQGADLTEWFTDDDCGDYAWNYMEAYFARGDYDNAVLSLTEALENWYYDNFDW